jgi:hypothetical protein
MVELSPKLYFILTQDVAEFLNINISDSVAVALASDVEYRIHQVVEVCKSQYAICDL